MTHSSHFICGDFGVGYNMVKERKEMFYLTMHSTHFYLRLYGVRHIVKDHFDSEKRNLLLPHGLLFPISSKGSFICTIPQTGLHIPQPLLHQSWSTGWMRNSSVGSPHEGSIWRPIAPWANALTMELHLAPSWCRAYGKRNKGNVLFNNTLNTFLFTVIWHQIYGKEPFR